MVDTHWEYASWCCSLATSPADDAFHRASCPQAPSWLYPSPRRSVYVYERTSVSTFLLDRSETQVSFSFSPCLWRRRHDNRSQMGGNRYPFYRDVRNWGPPGTAPFPRRGTSFCPCRSSGQAVPLEEMSPPQPPGPACLLPLSGRNSPTRTPFHLCKWCHEDLPQTMWHQQDSLTCKSCLYLWTQCLTPTLGNLDLEDMSGGVRCSSGLGVMMSEGNTSLALQ